MVAIQLAINSIMNIKTTINDGSKPKEINKYLSDELNELNKSININNSPDFSPDMYRLLETLKDVEEGGDFIFGAYSEYVENNCKSVEDLEVSLNALGEFTKYCSAEFAIRFFINNYPDESFSKMMKWAGSDNFHQRRFASEGLRPKLPWAKGINFDYKKGVLVLDELFHDNERYVTRSVANHLNDISKIDPDFVVEILKRWKESKKQDEKEMQYIISHSLRTAIKKGHVKSFNFLGFNENADVSINGLGIVDRRLRIGDSLEFSFEILA